MGAEEIKFGPPKCPKCPLIPIISIFINEESKIMCEYRCAFMHYGQIEYEKMFLDEENHHGSICESCKEVPPPKEELRYCGVCKLFFCSKCLPKHNKEKESHLVTVPVSKIEYTCLLHGEKIFAYCFTCLTNICKFCKRHEIHCVKEFRQFEPDQEFLQNYSFYSNDYNNYKKAVRTSANINGQAYKKFVFNSDLLINFAKSLRNNYYQRKNKNILCGEILINFLNVIKFDFKVNSLDDKINFDTKNKIMNEYCKTHCILKDPPISHICTFSKTKSDIRMDKLKLVFLTNIEDLTEEDPKDFFFIRKFGLIVYFINKIIYFFNVNFQKKQKIRLDQEINSLYFTKGKFLLVCSGKEVKIYELIKDEPFYREDETISINIDKESDDSVQQVFGDINKNLYIRTKKKIFLLNSENENHFKEIKSIDMSMKNENFNEDNKDKIPNNYDYFKDIMSYKYNNRKNNDYTNIQSHKGDIQSIKTLFNFDNTLISEENNYYILRDSKTLEIKKEKEISTITNRSTIIFNNYILVPNSNMIYFYSIPDIKKVSSISTSGKIVSLNVIKRKTLLVLEETDKKPLVEIKYYVEQFELNTWKRLFGEFINIKEEIKYKNNNCIKIFGEGIDLFLYYGKTRNIYRYEQK